MKSASRKPQSKRKYFKSRGFSRLFCFSWEQRKLGDCFDERNESMPDGELISVTINDGIRKFSELGRHDNSNDDKSKYKKVCVGDIAYNSMRMWQGASGYSPYEGIVSPAYTVLSPKMGVVSRCLAYQFKLPEMIHTFQVNSQGITSDNWNLKYPAFSEIEVAVAKQTEEQELIASFFTNLDNLITLHQRNSIGYIFKVRAYTNAWEQRKLEDYLTVSTEKNTGNIYGRSDVLSVSGDYGIVNQIEFQGRSFAGASVSNYGVVQTGDVVYTKSPLNSNPYGIIKTNKGKPGIVSTLYAVYHPKDNAFPDFIQVYFEQHARMNNYMHPLVNKGAKNDMKVSAENALKGPVCFPSRVEQESISAFFLVLDNLITLHQRKYFTGLVSGPITQTCQFTTAWEQRKAKELFVSTADKGYPELPVLSATQDRGMIRRDENSINIFHDKKNEAGYKRVLPGQFVIHLRSFQGGFAHSAIEGITSPAYTVFGFSEPEKHDSEYWKYVFTSKSFIQRLETVTYGIRDGRSISYEEFLTLGFVYPSKAEQTAIARYLDKA